MKKLFIVANFKSNKNRSEVEQWMDTFDQFVDQIPEGKTVVIAPPMPSIMFVSNRLLEKRAFLGIQDISPFEAGSFTGAVSAKNLEGFHVGFAIIGHSERREKFHEDDALLEQKVEQAISGKIETIFCVQGKDTPIPPTVRIVAYEPVFAIGSGNPDTPENADEVTKYIKENHNNPFVLYGGSVTPENVHTFTQMEHIDGVLVGGASLDAHKFAAIVRNA